MTCIGDVSHQSAAQSTFKVQKQHGFFCPSTDADGTCPTDANPLILEPPEVIEEYGSVVFVNCTSTTDYYDEMYWKYGTRESGIEEDSAFITGEMSLADWNVTAECKIKLNASLECSKNLEITIYSKCNFK